MPSQEETGIVLAQDPPAETMVRQGTSVSFTVSRQIEPKLTLRALPASIRPGESVTLAAELDPLLPGAEYQFSLGTGASSAWSTDAQAQFSYPSDGNYEATASARWNNGSVNSNPVNIVVHAIKYEVRLLPDPLDVKPGGTVSFRAEVSPEVERATYIYHFGDIIRSRTSSSPTAEYSYEKPGNYTAWVTVRIAESPTAAGAIHSHDFPSSPVLVTVEPPPPPIVLYVMGAAMLIAVVSYAAWKIKSWGQKPPELEILVHKDPGIQSLPVAPHMPKGTNVEIHVVRSWGEQSIKSQGPLWARIETIHE